MRSRVFVIAVFAALFSSNSFAADEFSSFYLSAFVERDQLYASDEPLGLLNDPIEPVVVSGVIGAWLRPGIAIEAELGVGVRDDTIGSLEVDVASRLAIGMRLESPPAGGLAAYFAFGAVRSELDVNDQTATNDSLSLGGGRLLLGLTYQFTPSSVIDLGVEHQNYDGDVHSNAFRLGVRFDLERRLGY